MNKTAKSCIKYSIFSSLFIIFILSIIFITTPIKAEEQIEKGYKNE